MKTATSAGTGAPTVIVSRSIENSTPAIRIESLGKEYIIGRRQSRQTFREMLVSVLGAPMQRLRRLRGKVDEEERFWALKEVSFEVQPGEVVGVIGRNGAGKSTLLKILCRITEPTTGRVKVRGRVASLLEVGTGFHPELTGRENIYLNGAILGMARTEIAGKFDDIVAFAEIERFLDTPVKRYSSGMYVRLAFAVAAHLESEVLLVDEVLAVGDAEFQRKCIGKMSDVAQSGRTVLFVSHNMAAVRRLCHRGIVIESGRVREDRNVESAIASYMSGVDSGMEGDIQPQVDGSRPQFARITLSSTAVNFGDTLIINAALVSPIEVSVAVEVEIHDEKGIPLIYTSTAPMGDALIEVSAGLEKNVRLAVGPLNLASGVYHMYFWLIKPGAEIFHVIREPIRFRIDLSDPEASGFDFKQSYGRGACYTSIRVIDIGEQ